MGDANCLISPEALRLLDEFINDSNLAGEPNGSSLYTGLPALDLPELSIDSDQTLEPSGYSLDAEVQVPHLPNREQWSPNRSLSTAQVTGFSTLQLPNIAQRGRKRAKFDLKTREKVATVRKKGACMRCRILKIPCSGEWPCKSCLRCQASCHEREPTHGWMACIPFSVKDVDIYALDYPCSQDEYNSIICASDIIITGNARSGSRPPIHWDLQRIASNCADWICEATVNSAACSRVWMLSSLDAERLLAEPLDANLSKALRVVVGTSSIIHNWGDEATFSHYTSSDLWSIRSFAGTQVLRGLATTLSIDRLAKASHDELKAIFLVLFGAVIAVGYTSSRNRQGKALSNSSPTHLFEEARQQLLKILAHHMIHIADRANLLTDQATKQSLLENAYHQWVGKAVFEWNIASTLHGCDYVENLLACDCASATRPVIDQRTYQQYAEHEFNGTWGSFPQPLQISEGEFADSMFSSVNGHSKLVSSFVPGHENVPSNGLSCGRGHYSGSPSADQNDPDMDLTSALESMSETLQPELPFHFGSVSNNDFSVTSEALQLESGLPCDISGFFYFEAASATPELEFASLFDSPFIPTRIQSSTVTQGNDSKTRENTHMESPLSNMRRPCSISPQLRKAKRRRQVASFVRQKVDGHEDRHRGTCIGYGAVKASCVPSNVHHCLSETLPNHSSPCQRFAPSPPLVPRTGDLDRRLQRLLI